MKEYKYSLSTQIMGTEDGKYTYEVRKIFDITEGKRAVVIALYPTVSLMNPYIMDNSTLYLLNKSNELGYNDFRIVNIYSKVCKGKLSAKQLAEEDDNISYLDKVFREEKNDNTDIIIAWGSSLKFNETTKSIKIHVLKSIKKYIQPDRIKQFSAGDLKTKSCMTPHVLWMGLHCGEMWYTEVVSVDALLDELNNTKDKKKITQV